MAVTEDAQRGGLTVEVRLAERLLAVAVERLDPADVSLRDVDAAWVTFDRIERLAANAKTVLAGRVEESGEWKVAGARSAAAHLGRLSGSGAVLARRMIENSRALPGLPGVVGAMRTGGLSAAQVEAIVPAAAADPAAEVRLIGFAGTTSVFELREECLRTKAAADPDPEAAHSKIHEHRRLATRVDAGGGWNLHGRGTVAEGARFEAALEPVIDRLFERGRVQGRKEPREAYAFDALIELADRDGSDSCADARVKRPKPRYMAILHVDLEALIRGEIDGDEKCEIPGLGPIPVRVARELLGDAILKLVITRGVDVANVVHLGRGPTAAQRIAVLWSKPKCANVACSSRFVQLDHRDPWANTHHTTLDEIDPLCLHDHYLKTHCGWLLVEGTGRRAFVPPNDPRSPRNKPPP
jgi:Domain of unknown function (DUF222)